MEGGLPLSCRTRLIVMGVGAVLALAIATPAQAEFKVLGQWGQPAGGELLFPRDVERDNAGNTYAVDIFTPAVHKYDAANNHVLSWGSLGRGRGQFGNPFAIGVNEATGDVYVGDLWESGPDPNIRIEHFDSNGNFLGEWGSIGSAEGQFNGILSIAVNSGTGDVFVAEGNRVQRFNSAGQFELMWGKNVDPAGGAGPETCAAGCQAAQAGDAEGELRFPSGIATNANQVFVSENGNSRISRFNATTGAFQLMGGADVVPGGGTGHEQCAAACKTGERGSANGELDETQGIDANGTFVWIADEGNHRVQRWSNNLAFVNAFGTQGGGDGQFQRPNGITENSGTVIVTDLLPSRLQAFNGAGLFQASFAAPGVGTLLLPVGLAAGPGGVYVTDAQNRVVRFDDQGTLIGRWGGEGAGVGQFMSPSAAAVAPNGDVYVVDTGNDRIQRFDANGAALGSWGTTGTDPGQFQFPIDAAVAPDGSVYVLESTRVQKFTPIGGFDGAWGAPGDAPGQFAGASGIGVGPDGSVYVADTSNERVQKFSAEGQFVVAWGSEGTGDGQFDSPRDVAIDGAGNVFVVDRGLHRVQRFTSAGVFRDRLGAGGGDGSIGGGPGEFNQPVSVAVDTHGYVYVVEQFGGRVQKFVATPELVVSGAPRQRLKELVVSAACESGPCEVGLSGKIVVKPRRKKSRAPKPKKVSIALSPVSLTLDAGASAEAPLKPAKRGKRWREAKALLKDRARGKVSVAGAVTNAAGAGAPTSLAIQLSRR